MCLKSPGTYQIFKKYVADYCGITLWSSQIAMKNGHYIYIYILNVNDLPTKMVGIAYISYVRHLPGGRILVAPSRPSSKRDVIQQSIDASQIGFQDIPGKGENSWKKQKKLRTRALAMTDFDSAHSHYTFNQ